MGNLLAKITAVRQRLKHLSDVFEGKLPRVLIVGLDGAGKTTLLFRSKLDHTIYANVPPRGVNIEHARPRRGARIQLIDLPGAKLARHLWRPWFKQAEALVFVVDGADRVRVDEARFELHELIAERHLRRVPLIVVANKQDAEGVMGEEELRLELDLASIQDRDVSVHYVSAINGTRIQPVLMDVVDKIRAFRHYKSGLGLDGKASTPGSRPSTEVDKDSVRFTSIEDADAATANGVPVTDLDADDDVVAGPSGVQGNHTGRPGLALTRNDSDSGSDDVDYIPSPDSVSDNDQNPEDVVLKKDYVDSNIHNVDLDVNETDNDGVQCFNDYDQNGDDIIPKEEDKTIDTDHHKLSHGDDTTTDVNNKPACIDNTDDARNELDDEANHADECQSGSSISSSGTLDDSETNSDRYPVPTDSERRAYMAANGGVDVSHVRALSSVSDTGSESELEFVEGRMSDGSEGALANANADPDCVRFLDDVIREQTAEV